MARFQHTRSIITSIIILLLLEAIYLKQSYFAVLFAPLIGTAIVAILWFIGGNISRRIILKLKKILLPALLLIGAAFFLLYEPSKLLRQIIIALTIFSFYFFALYYRRIPLERKEYTISITNYLAYSIILATFLVYLVVYDIFFTFFLPLWVAMVIVIIFSYLVFYYYFWATAESDPIILVFSTLLGIISVELFFILSFWRAELIIRSVILTTIFYVFLGVLNLKLKRELVAKRVMEYLIVAIIVLTLVISTIRWEVF